MLSAPVRILRGAILAEARSVFGSAIHLQRLQRLPAGMTGKLLRKMPIDSAMLSCRGERNPVAMWIDRIPSRLDAFRWESPRSAYNVGGIRHTMHDMTQEKMIVLRY